MFQSVCAQFPTAQHITESGDASDICADVVLFFDVHSSHHIQIDGILEHPATKIEYFNDPHQEDTEGVYRQTGQKFHKLGAKNRVERARFRGVTHIICPYRSGYDKYIRPLADDMVHLWMPVSPMLRRASVPPLAVRRPEALLTGHLWPGKPGFTPYETRRQAAKAEILTVSDHACNTDVPKGRVYQAYLSQFAGIMCLCDVYVVPKYIETLLAGSLCFCQWHDEMSEMGFRDGINCVVVDKDNFEGKVRHFLDHVSEYQDIASKGRELAVEEYTSDVFARKLRNQLAEIQPQTT